MKLTNEQIIAAAGAGLDQRKRNCHLEAATGTGGEAIQIENPIGQL